MAVRNEATAMRCDVELDMFSGMPNPTWSLTDDEADSFAKQLAALPQTSAKELSGRLGYRGFLVQCRHGAETRSIRIQGGTVHISTGATDGYASDEHRKFERWLLATGKPHLKNEHYQIVERELR